MFEWVMLAGGVLAGSLTVVYHQSINGSTSASKKVVSDRQVFVKPAFRLVFSMTTTPERLKTLRPRLLSLLSQSVGANAVYLNLPRVCARNGEAYVIPPRLQRFFDRHRDRLIVQRCDKDWGPATKLLPTLRVETHPDTRLIPVDDDVEFPLTYFEELVSQSAAHPDVAWGYHARDTWQGKTMALLMNVKHDVKVLETVAGVIYRRTMFPMDVAEIERAFHAHPECRLCDDILLASFLAQHGVRRRLLRAESMSLPLMGRKGQPARLLDAPDPLFLENIDGGRNKRCYQSLRKSFELDSSS